MALKKTIITSVKSSRSGKYVSNFMDGVMERWALAQQQATMNFQLDMKNQEVRMKFYRDRLDYLDNQLNNLQKERRVMEANDLSNQQRVSNANVLISNNEQTWNKSQIASLDLADAQATKTPGSARRIVTKRPGSAGGTGRGTAATSKAVTDIIGKLGDEDILREGGDRVRRSVTDEDFVKVGSTAVGGKDYLAAQTETQKKAHEAQIYLSQKEKLITDAALKGTIVTDANAETRLTQIYEGLGKGQVLVRMKDSWASLQPVVTDATSGTGATASDATYTTYGAKKGKWNKPTAQTVDLEKQKPVTTNFKTIDDAINKTLQARGELEAPTFNGDFDLIGNTRKIYSNKFHGDGGEASNSVRKLLKIGELYGQEAAQEAFQKLDWKEQQDIGTAANDELMAEQVAPTEGVTPAVGLGTGEVAEQPVEPANTVDIEALNTDAIETEAPTSEIQFKPANDVIASKLSSSIVESTQAIQLMLPVKGETFAQSDQKIKSIEKWFRELEQSAPTSLKNKVYHAYRDAKSNGESSAATIELIKKMFPSQAEEAWKLGWQMFRLGEFI